LLLRWLSIALGGWGLLVLLCAPALARTSHEPHGGNCVAYARDVTGIHLDGNAASWWLHAEGRYDRGHQPAVGAVLVFKPYAGMHVGHVAVVSRVVGPREVLVDQANWVRGRVTRAMSVIDASPSNDWTSVKVQYAGTHGRENPTYGFIYPRALLASFGETIAEPQHDRGPADRVAERATRDTEATKDHVARADPRAVRAGEAIVEPEHRRHHADRVAERGKRQAEAKVARADPAPAPAGETIVEPRHNRKTAAHAKRHAGVKEDQVARADSASASAGESAAEPRDRRHGDRVAERATRHAGAKDDQVARADLAPAHPGATIVEPPHDRKPTAHAKRPKDSTDKTATAQSAEPPKSPSPAAAAAERKKHKTADTKLAYLY
jgi:surface antigen